MITKDRLVKMVGDLTVTLLPEYDPQLPELKKVQVILCAIMAGVTGQQPETLDSLYIVATSLAIQHQNGSGKLHDAG